MALLRSFRFWTITAAVLAALVGFAWYYAGGFILHRAIGGEGWPKVSVTDFRLSHAMRRAWETPPPAVRPGPLEWQTVAPGFEIAELPVLTDAEEIDRIYLARISPQNYDFQALAKPGRSISQWEQALPDAVLIVNGSFFGPHNEPDTPFISNGAVLGPASYDAKAGAFVATASGADVVDLTTGAGWKPAFAGARNAMVAYPLLIGDDGKSHVLTNSRWLSNRSFVGRDSSGRIIIGSTREAFFSLTRLAEFLIAAPLDLTHDAAALLDFDLGSLLNAPRPLSFAKDGSATHSREGDPIAAALVSSRR